MKRLNLPTIVGSAALQRVQPISSLCGGTTWRQETGRRRVVMLEKVVDVRLCIQQRRTLISSALAPPAIPLPRGGRAGRFRDIDHSHNNHTPLPSRSQGVREPVTARVWT
jgi:hypothetical protein